ncbi:DoxX family protein [Rufibacter tibetensis]|uniref:DoxX family protein n=1 Tax=Rufibacter tibetensis TaxID=512763 RepID=A0A0P0CWC3_9BACT|nr:DoxX family protein [Rufibacter tibetensis]ALI98877.1 hypothetical protein DC20_07680 [Rufibacter tibetensis]
MKTITSLTSRILFSLLFLVSGVSHFSAPTIAYASSQGVPLAELMVPFSGAMALAGALSIILGYKARLGALLIIMFLVPITFTMHQFWVETDPMAYQMQFIMFLKNLSILGGAIQIVLTGIKESSLDQVLARRKHGLDKNRVFTPAQS